MLKFKCTHCGGRLAIQEKHLTRLTKCPDCGQITHPMAGQILAQKQQQRKRRIECDNCARPLGRLVRPRKWADATVCGACFRELALEQMEQDQADAQQATYLDAPSHGVLVTTGTARRTASGVVTTMQLPYMTSLPGGALPVISLNSAHSGEVRQGAKLAAAGMFIAFAAIFSLTIILRMAGYLLLWSAIAAAIVGIAYWFGRRWLPAPAHKSDHVSGSSGNLILQISSAFLCMVGAGAAAIWHAARRLVTANPR